MNVITICYPNGRGTTYRPSEEAQKKLDALHEKHGPGEASPDALWKLATCLPSDFKPWGKRSRESRGNCHNDCSCGCNYFHPLQGIRGMDWGVCHNPKSPRKGMLTFEHMGCPKWTEDPRYDAIDKEELKILKADRRKQKRQKQS